MRCIDFIEEAEPNLLAAFNCADQKRFETDKTFVTWICVIKNMNTRKCQNLKDTKKKLKT